MAFDYKKEYKEFYMFQRQIILQSAAKEIRMKREANIKKPLDCCMP